MASSSTSRRWFHGLRRLLLIGALAAAGLFAVFFLRFVPIIRDAPASSPASTAEAQRLDLEYLRTFSRYDRSFTPPNVRADFEQFVDSLTDKDPARSVVEFELAVARAVALADNGHTSITAAARRRRLGDDLPIRLGRFAEGMFVLQATAEYATLLGARIDAIGGISTDELLDRLATYYGGPASRARYQAHLDLTSPSLLHALGAADLPVTTSLAVTFSDGRQDTITLAALPPRPGRRRPAGRAAYLHDELDRDSAEVWRTLTARVPPPLPLRDPGRRFAVHRLAGGPGIYVRIDANENAPDERLGAFTKRVMDTIGVRRPRFTVIDLRHNPGGTSTLGSFARRVITSLPPEGRVYVIVSGGTFSYGIATAALLRKYGGDRTLIVGEPIGDRLRFWANGGSTFRLPHSGITLRAWSGLEDFAEGCRDWRNCFWMSPFFFRGGVGSLDLDLAAAPSLADYLDGRDTALERILELEAARR